MPFKGTLLTDLSAGVLFGNPPAHKGPDDSGYQAYLDALENLKKLKICPPLELIIFHLKESSLEREKELKEI